MLIFVGLSGGLFSTAGLDVSRLMAYFYWCKNFDMSLGMPAVRIRERLVVILPHFWYTPNIRLEQGFMVAIRYSRHPHVYRR